MSEFVLDIEDVNAAVESHGATWEGTNEGGVRAEHYMGEVMLSLWQESNESTNASVSAYVEPSVARDIAAVLRDGGAGNFATSSCTMWINRGWLYTDGPMRDDDGHNATITVDAEGTSANIELEYEDETDGKVVTQTLLSQSERAITAGALDGLAEKAEKYEPQSPTAETDVERKTVEGWMPQIARVMIPIGITFGIFVLTMDIVTEAMSNMTINGEPMSPPNPLFGGVLLFAMVVFVIYTVERVPRMGSRRW